MGRRQIAILGLAMLLAGLDGYDALSMAFVAPVVAVEWHLGKETLGLLLASALVGMAFGSIVISPIADRVGRKPVILGSLLLMAGGSILSAIAQGVALLAAARLLTGVGIGTMVTMTTLISAEFSNARARPLAVAAVATIGFPAGGLVGGLAAAAMLHSGGWPAVFLVGAVAGGLLFITVATLLPESPAFLVVRRSLRARDRLDRVLLSLGHATTSPSQTSPSAGKTSYSALFEQDTRRVTLRLIGINLLVAMAGYYMMNWLPQLVVDAGFSPAAGSVASAVSGFAGCVGGVFLGALAMRFRATRLAAGAMAGLAVSLIAIGFAPATFGVLIAASAFFGLCLSGMTGTLYGVIANAFPPSMRASGLGLVLGLGRIASAIGPALAGWMFGRGLGRPEVSAIFALAPLIAAGLMLRFSREAGRPPARR